MQEKLNKYKDFLRILDRNLKDFFENQKEFIMCSAGCSHCCSAGYYPLTELEYEFVKIGFNRLEKEKQDIIIQSIQEINSKKNLFLQAGEETNDFSYQCPMLINNLCSLYDYRPIICRVYGLISPGLDDENKYKIPSCRELGLNYSNVWDEEIKDFSLEKAKKLNLKSNPEAFDVGYQSLLKKFAFMDFGSIKMMFEWFR